MAQLANSTITSVNNLGTSSSNVIGANPSRMQITFHAPGSNDIYVFPSLVLVSGANSTLTPSLSTLGGGFRVFAGATLTISGPAASQSWQALAASGSNQPLTIMEQTQ